MKDARERLMLWKWLYWKNGISSKDFWQEKITDIYDIIEIDNSINRKELRERQVQKMLRSIK